MALSGNAILPAKSIKPQCPILPHQPSFSLIPSAKLRPIYAIQSADKNPIASTSTSTSTSKPTIPASASTTAPLKKSPSPQKWTLDSWKSKKALQLPEYPDANELEAVLKTIEDFPPIVFAGEARILEERLADAALGNAFLLQGGDCAESFKEFNANNIRDTFRVLLQMGAVLMYGGQMPVIKVSFSP